MIPLLINTKTANVSSEDETMLVIDFGSKKYTFEPKYEKRMLEWVGLQNDDEFNTLVPKLMKLKSFRSLNDFYMNGSVAEKMKIMHNRGNKKSKFNREKFIKIISKIVEFEITNEDGKTVKRFTKNTDFKTLSFRVISECPIPCKIE